MALIKMSPEELRESAVKYATGSEDVSDVLRRLEDEQAKIGDNWHGAASESFARQFDELSVKVREFAQLLLDIQKQLNDVAQVVEDTDNEIANKIGG